MARQFVVQLENHPGELAHITRAFAARGINLLNVACVGAGPLACMVASTDDDAAARKVLYALGHEFIEGQPVMVEVEDRPGGLADITERLASAGVNITGMLPVGQRPGIVEMAFCVDNEARARVALGMDPAHAASVSS